MPDRAVVFDLWNTLVRFPDERSRALRAAWARRLGVDEERLEELWGRAATYERRETGPLRPVLEEVARALGRDGGAVEELLAWRLDLVRNALRVEPETLSALDELRRRGFALGLVSNCTEEVPLVWPETELAPRFHAAVFSARAGVLKPDPRIYRLVCAELGVEPGACLFVGDGANDELAGAERAGMRPVLLDGAGGEIEWRGPRISSIPEVLELVE
ncbi:MAG TPA: HAD family hydrolase [Gaiellaceae bacterium]|nr:HAD family hydrolase [Gaiellaceae bacterium]